MAAVAMRNTKPMYSARYEIIIFMPLDWTTTSSAVNESVTGQGFGPNFHPEAATSALGGEASPSICASSLSPSVRLVLYMRLSTDCSGTTPWARRSAITESGTIASAPLEANAASSNGWRRSSPVDVSVRPAAWMVSPLPASASARPCMPSSVLFTA